MSFGRFEKKEIIDITSCSWSPYWQYPKGPEGAIQFNSHSYFSGSANLIYDYSQSILSLEGDLIVHGNITAEQYIISSSILYYTTSYFSGSTKFGDTLDDTHQFTGSVYITGSSYLIGNSTITGSMYIQSGSIVMDGPTASISGVDYIDFSNQYTVGTNEPPWKEGRLFYDSGSGALSFYNWEQDVTLNIGQEQWLRARNQTGVTITNGSVVKLSSAIGDRPTVVLAQAIDQTNTFSLTNDIIGMATHDIENGTDGFVTTFGLVNGVNTNAFNAGDLLWVSQSAGQYTNVPPGPPYDKLFVGVVTRKNANNGTIFVTPQQSIHFHDISSVSASLYTQGDIWMYKITGSSGVWTNTKTLSGSYVISGSLTVVNGITGSLYGTASYAITASRSISSSYAISASYSISSSYSFSSSYAISASYSFSSSYAISSSFAISSSRAVTASFATTASYVNLLAGPNITINYLSTGIAITGSGGGSSITFYNGNTNVLHTSTLTGIYVTGSGITTTNNSGNVTMSFSTGSSGGSAISFYSGSTLLTSNLSSLRITGSGVTATVNASNGVTMSFSGSGGGTGTVGPGTINTIPKFTTTTTIGDSDLIWTSAGSLTNRDYFTAKDEFKIEVPGTALSDYRDSNLYVNNTINASDPILIGAGQSASLKTIDLLRLSAYGLTIHYSLAFGDILAIQNSAAPADYVESGVLEITLLGSQTTGSGVNLWYTVAPPLKVGAFVQMPATGSFSLAATERFTYVPRFYQDTAAGFTKSAYGIGAHDETFQFIYKVINSGGTWQLQVGLYNNMDVDDYTGNLNKNITVSTYTIIPQLYIRP